MPAGTGLTSDTGVYVVASQPVIDSLANAWRYSQTNTNTSSKTVFCYSLCCRVPGR